MDDEQFQLISKALADPRRREILDMIASSMQAASSLPEERHEPIHCSLLVERLPIGQPTVSHHIRELTRAGLIEITPSGSCHFLTLRLDTFTAYVETLRTRFCPSSVC